ncbi:MAG: hypothetical protein KatS3mg117_3249 [Geminicoccaceae bacterium]|nr:MAG: hypothetical protein KatS3mg117_3249 [Geminicoccaceae bacterium]
MIRKAWFNTVIANLLLLVTGMATGVLSARLLGPEGRGLLSAVTFWPMLVAGLATLSLPEAIVARSATIGRDAGAVGISALLLGLLAGASAVMILAPALTYLLGPERADFRILALCFAIGWVPVWNANAMLVGLDQASQRFFIVNLLRIAPSALYLAGLCSLWITGNVSVRAFAWAMLAAAVLTLALRLLFGWRRLLGVPDKTTLAALLSVGLRFHAHAVLFLLASQADRMVLLLAFSDADIGHYVVATTFAQSGLAAVTSAVSFVLFPAMAAEPDRARARALLALWLRRTVLLLYVVVPPSLAITPWLLPFLFGPAFADAVPIAATLLLAMIPLALRETIIRCVRAFGEARVGVASEGASLAVFVLAVGPLMLAGGPIGIAAARLLGQLAGLFVCAQHLASRHDIVPSTWLLPGREGVADALAIGRSLVRRAAA